MESDYQLTIHVNREQEDTIRSLFLYKGWTFRKEEDAAVGKNELSDTVNDQHQWTEFDHWCNSNDTATGLQAPTVSSSHCAEASPQDGPDSQNGVSSPRPTVSVITSQPESGVTEVEVSWESPQSSVVDTECLDSSTEQVNGEVVVNVSLDEESLIEQQAEDVSSAEEFQEREESNKHSDQLGVVASEVEGVDLTKEEEIEILRIDEDKTDHHGEELNPENVEQKEVNLKLEEKSQEEEVSLQHGEAGSPQNEVSSLHGEVEGQQMEITSQQNETEEQEKDVSEKPDEIESQENIEVSSLHGEVDQQMEITSQQNEAEEQPNKVTEKRDEIESQGTEADAKGNKALKKEITKPAQRLVKKATARARERKKKLLMKAKVRKPLAENSEMAGEASKQKTTKKNNAAEKVDESQEGMDAAETDHAKRVDSDCSLDYETRSEAEESHKGDQYSSISGSALDSDDMNEEEDRNKNRAYSTMSEAGSSDFQSKLSFSSSGKSNKKVDEEREKERYQSKLNYLFRRARFFKIMSNNHENISLAKAKGLWATLPYNQEKLTKAFIECDNVILVFSVQKSGRFQGFARVISKCIRDYPPVRWVLPDGPVGTGLTGAFKLDWISRKDLQFEECKQLINPWNENKPVKIGRDGQEIQPKCGRALCRLFPMDKNVDLNRVVDRSRRKNKSSAYSSVSGSSSSRSTLSSSHSFSPPLRRRRLAQPYFDDSQRGKRGRYDDDRNSGYRGGRTNTRSPYTTMRTDSENTWSNRGYPGSYGQTAMSYSHVHPSYGHMGPHPSYASPYTRYPVTAYSPLTDYRAAPVSAQARAQEQHAIDQEKYEKDVDDFLRKTHSKPSKTWH